MKTIPSKKEIIAKFKKSSIVIKDSDCKKRDKGMVVTIHADYGLKLFSTYFGAYNFYSRLNLIN